MVLGQVVGELLVGGVGEHSLLPQIRGEVGVCLGDSGIGGLSEVAERGSLAPGAGVAILNTSHLKQLLGN